MPQFQTLAPRAPQSTMERTAARHPLMRRVRTRTLLSVTGQMALMLRTGTPLLDSLEALRSQTSDERMYQVLTAIQGEVSGGASLTQALRAHPQVFDRFYVNVVEAGEASGLLADVLRRLELFLRKRMEMWSNTITALIYPMIIAVVASLAVMGLLTFVLPRFIRIFQKAGVQLPLPTRMLLAISGFIVSYWPFLLLAAIVVPVSLVYVVRTSWGGRLFDLAMLRAPLVGPLTRQIQSSAILRTLGTLLGSGVSLLDSLQVAGNACRNRFFRAFMDDVRLGVTRGGTIASSFAKTDLVAPSVKAMVATGERSGALATVMTEVADYLDRESDRSLKKLSALLEPILIIIMGVVVGFMAISILLPLFELSGLAGRH